MTAFFSKPSVQKPLRYVAAYFMLALFIVGGLAIFFSVRENIFDICGYFKVDQDLVYILYSWGSWVLLVPWVFSVPILESYLNTAAKTGQVYKRVKRLLIWETSIIVASYLISLLFKYLISIR
jgi:hypothetical protein